MKKNTIWKTALALTIVLSAGCHSAKEAQREKYYIFATPLASHPIWLQAKKGFFDACRDLGVNGDWLGPNVIDVDAMEKVVRTGVLQKADGIITQGVLDSDVMKEAKKNSVPVVLVDSDMRPEDRLCFIGKDFHHQAELFLQDIEQRRGKDVHLTIAIQAANLDFDIARQQIDEIRSVFALHPGGFEIVSLSSSMSDEVRSQKEWTQVLAEHPEVNVAINFAGESGCCCYDAASRLKRQDDILIYGVDDIEHTVDYVRQGKIQGTVITSFYQYGYQSMMILQSYSDMMTSPSISNIKPTLLTRETLEEAARGKDQPAA